MSLTYAYYNLDTVSFIEKLCENTVIHEQNLIAPLPLELSVSEEDCVLENLDVFELHDKHLHLHKA